MIEYILCYSTAFFLGMLTAMLLMWFAVVKYEKKLKK